MSIPVNAAGADTEEVLRQQADRLRILNDIGRDILTAASPTAIARGVVRHLRQLVPCDAASVVMFDLEYPEAVVLAIEHTRSFGFESGARVPLETLGDVDSLRSGQVTAIRDLQPAPGPSPLLRALSARGVRTYFAIPLIAQSELIGFLDLLADKPDAFGPEHLDLTREVAEPLAVAIQQARLLEQVYRGRQRMQDLSRRLLEVQEAERRHLARELHDEIGQALTGLMLSLEMSVRQSPPELAGNLTQARGLVQDLMGRVRQMSLDLRPAMLDDVGLLPTLLWHLDQYTSLTGIDVSLDHTGVEGRRFLTEVETAAYRIVQEALTNVARHAGPCSVTLYLHVSFEGLVIEVVDRGVGFDPNRVLSLATTGGLPGMRERAMLVGGRLTVRSAPGQGTQVTAELPLGRHIERRPQPRTA